jgi:hypothetical protein
MLMPRSISNKFILIIIAFEASLMIAHMSVYSKWFGEGRYSLRYVPGLELNSKCRDQESIRFILGRQ